MLAPLRVFGSALRLATTPSRSLCLSYSMLIVCYDVFDVFAKSRQ